MQSTTQFGQPNLADLVVFQNFDFQTCFFNTFKTWKSILKEYLDYFKLVLVFKIYLMNLKVLKHKTKFR